MTVEFICEQLAEMFDEPCNFSPIDEMMFQNKAEFCEKNCGDVKKSECWKEYFSLVADMRGEE